MIKKELIKTNFVEDDFKENLKSTLHN